MLAPVLARLDSLPGIASARVDSSGRFFWIVPSAGADPAEVTALAGGVLGKGARLLDARQAEAQLAMRAAGDPWHGASEVRTLSFVESRLLSVRIAAEAARRAGAGPDEREVLAEGIRAALFAAMGRVHAEGGRSSSGWIYVEWPAIAADAIARCGNALPPERGQRIGALLPELLKAS